MDADSYVAALDEQGNWLWAVMPDAAVGLTLIQTMTVSITGDVYIGGLIFDTVTFGNTASLSAANGYGDGFVAKIDANGQWVWAVNFNTATNNASNTSRVMGLAETFSGNLIVSGYHKGVTDFGGITEVSPDNELFLMELDRNSGQPIGLLLLVESETTMEAPLQSILWVISGRQEQQQGLSLLME